ncbi:S41 family peptidase [Embleya hyalina]|uniref:Tail specific protease domain-containing protein n=1 Tax=Embleya hyalina TaxID=516124 RepID=A0A401YTP3_9ACTN|nr:S41 family peptidase [Embleya hyalina]GCD97977.1 hypothetical protein EHYA_05677 [Embleya hyalina]
MTKLFGTCATVAAATLLATTAGIASATADTAPRERPSPHQDGVWRVDGYGTVLTIENGTLQQYDTTAISCLKGSTATRATVDGDTIGYQADNGRVLAVRVNPNRGQATLHFTDAPDHRNLRRVAALPATCSRPLPGDPRTTFDVFHRTFAENYPFFAAKGVDWRSVGDRYRSRVGPNTTDDELFGIFREMLDPLDDAHLYLNGGPNRFFAEARPGTTAPTPELDARIKAYIQERDLGADHPLTEYGQGRISYTDLPDGQGYLRVSGFLGYVEDPRGGYAVNAAELDRALNSILTTERVHRLRGLIVDLRVNGGGADNLGLNLAARLTDRPYFAYAKQARNDPLDPAHFTPAQPIRVRPAPGVPHYTGPLAVLTGGSTVSAGETFTQSLMNRPGHTVRIGEATQGVFSDVLDRALPNGWRLGLPNEVFRTRDGTTFDGTGIPPHISEPVFTDEEFAHHKDSAFDRAAAELHARAN